MHNLGKWVMEWKQVRGSNSSNHFKETNGSDCLAHRTFMASGLYNYIIATWHSIFISFVSLQMQNADILFYSCETLKLYRRQVSNNLEVQSQHLYKLDQEISSHIFLHSQSDEQKTQKKSRKPETNFELFRYKKEFMLPHKHTFPNQFWWDGTWGVGHT